MSGSLSPCRRSRCAMRQLNPELSIVTTTSGRISSIARTVSRTCLRISGARGNTSATPATARSARGTRLVSPSSAMLSPPMPAIRSRPPVRSRNAAISAPPIASPDGSPATMKINGGASWPPVIVPWSWCGDTHHEQPGLVGGADHFGAVEDQRRAGFGGDPPQPRLGGEDDGAYPDRRPVDALLLSRLCRLDEHPAPPVATKPRAAPPIRHQACGTPSTVAGSASPSSASTNTSRPAARQLSTRRRGSAPLPATIPRGPGRLSAIRPFRLADRPAGIGADEGDHVVDRTDAAKAAGGLVDPVVEGAFGRKQELIGAAQALDVLAAEAVALHADDVEPAEPRPVAHHLAVGDHIALDARHAADHRMPADPHELVHRREAAEQRKVLDDDMAGQGGVIGHDHMVADLAIMRDMDADHEQAMVADAGHHAAALGSRVHRHVFADRIVAADAQRGVFAAIFEVLRLQADRGERKDARPLADYRAPLDDDMRHQPDAGAELDLPAEDAIRADDHVIGQIRTRRDDRGGVDLRHRRPTRGGSSRQTPLQPSTGR